MDVVLLRWPLEQERRERLATESQLRLLLVEGGVAAPECTDQLEDWIRVPADEADVRARVDALARRYRDGRDDLPELDHDGLLRFGGGWVSLPPVEARLMSALIERYGAVVSRDQLSRTGWPKGAPGRNALDVHVLRLRRRIAHVGPVDQDGAVARLPARGRRGGGPVRRRGPAGLRRVPDVRPTSGRRQADVSQLGGRRPRLPPWPPRRRRGSAARWAGRAAAGGSRRPARTAWAPRWGG